MKKIFCIILCIVMFGVGLVGCGPTDEEIEQITSEYYSDTTAIIYLDGNLIVEGPVERELQYSNGIYIITIDGMSYKTHASNIVIIKDISKGE